MILVYAGRRADPGDGSAVDLPAQNVPFLGERIDRLLSSLRPDIVIGSAANGTDLLVVEAARRRRANGDGALIHIVLGPTVETFRASSVADRPGPWGATFDRVVADLHPSRLHLVDDPLGDPYSNINARIVDVARAHRRESDEIIGLVVRGAERSNPDFTADLEAQLLDMGALVLKLDPAVRKEHRPVCFVAMPYGRKPDPLLVGAERDMDAVYERVFVPLLEEGGFDYRRGDRQFDQGLIRPAFIEELLDADIVVADLTTLNANVMWELGLRHFAKKATTILVAVEGTRPIFDLSDVPLAQYPYNGVSLSEQEAVGSIRALRPSLAAIDRGRIDSPFRSVIDVEEPILWRSRRGAGDVAADELFERTGRAFDGLDEAALCTVADELTRAGLSRPQRRAVALEVARVAIAIGECPIAVRVLEPLLDDDPDVIYSEPRERLALALYRPRAATITDLDRAERLLEQVLAKHPRSVEALGMRAAVAKRRLFLLLDAPTAALRGAIDVTAQRYEDAFAATSAHWHGVNALSLRRASGQHLGAAVEPALQLLPVVRFFAERARQDDPTEHWAWASLGEVELSATLLGAVKPPSIEAAAAAYGRAGFAAGRDLGAIRSMREQLDLLRRLGDPSDVIDPLLAVLATQ
jgi:hypothetical protein